MKHQELMEYLSGDEVRRINMGSFDIAELIRRRMQDMISSGQWVSSPGVSSLSSPFGASFGGQERGFHMHVNAELILYGGAEPNARVRIDGTEIKLREDG